MKRSRWTRPSSPTPPPPVTGEKRKPRILVAGEFSAGKTRLINGLAGAPVLPSNVTATALPPIWLVGGADGLARVDQSGRMSGVAGLSAIELEGTSYCFMGHSAPIFDGLDIIDTPGNSDPNMAAVTWQRMLDYADAVVWCTNGTQAWRQSEKAVWQAMPERLRRNAMLIITHADLLPDLTNARRVLQRVEREAAPFFDTFLMASLLDSDDMDSIRDHIRDLAVRLGDGTGAANARMADFMAGKAAVMPAVRPAANPPAEPASDQPAAPARGPQGGERAAPAPGRQMVRPRRVRRDKAVEAQPADDFKVVQLARTSAAAQQPGPARTTWERLANGIDRTDPAAILAAVDRLVATLDSDAKTAPDGAETTSGKAPGGHAVAADGTE